MMFSLGSSNIMLTLVLLLCGTILAKESSNGICHSSLFDCSSGTLYISTFETNISVNKSWRSTDVVNAHILQEFARRQRIC